MGTDVEADHHRARSLGQRDVGFGDRTDAGREHASAHLVVADLLQRADDGLHRALHVALDDERELLAAGAFLELAHHLGERAAGARAGATRGQTIALLALAVVGDLAGAGFRLDDRDAVAGFRRAVEAEHLDRQRRRRFLDLSPGIGDQRADAAPFGAGDDDVAGAQGAALDEHGRDRAAAAVELGLDHRALGDAVGVGLEVEHLGLQRDRLEQRVETLAGLGRDLDLQRLAAERLDLDLVLQQLGADPVRIRVGLVDLVDRHDQRHLGRLGVVDGLDRLRHHAVIGRDHQHDDVRHLGAAGAHRREGGVAGRVDEGHLGTRRRRHLIGADMLGDATGFAGDDMGLADRVEQRSLAVVDMAHDRHDRRARDQGLVRVRRVEQAFLDVGFGDALDGVAHLLGHELGGVGVDHVGDLVHRALLHQQADDVDAPLGHAVGEFLDGDRLGDDHLAHHTLFLSVRGAMAGHALHAAAERGERTGPLVVPARGGRERQATARLVADLRSLGCWSRRSAIGGAGRSAGTPEGGTRLAVIRTAARRTCRRRRLPRGPGNERFGGRIGVGTRRARRIRTGGAEVQARRTGADIARRRARPTEFTRLPRAGRSRARRLGVGRG